jgi:hypothetical protein
MFALRGAAQTWHAGRRSMPSSYLCSKWVPIQLDSFISSNACFCSTGETEFRSDGMNRAIPARLSLARGSVSEGARKKSFPSLTTTSIQVLSSSIISPSSRASNVRSHFPLSASHSRALGTARSRRLGPALVKAHVNAAEPCVQENTIAR